MGIQGRPRTTTCVAKHIAGQACRTCARQRAARFRRRHVEKVRSYDNHRKTDPDRQKAVRARATLHRAITRGQLTPPLRCAACGTRQDALRPLQPDPAQPRVIAWVCRKCRGGLLAIGGEVTATWHWPGLQPPRRTRRLPLFDAIRHQSALQEALSQGKGTEQENAYVLSYLKDQPDADSWLAHGIRAGNKWEPTPLAVINELWRRYCRRWWQRERERLERDDVRPEIVITIEPTRHAPTVAPKAAPQFTGPRLSVEEQIAHLESAEMEFERTVQRILENIDH
jgi:hypothetical protein